MDDSFISGSVGFSESLFDNNRNFNGPVGTFGHNSAFSRGDSRYLGVFTSKPIEIDSFLEDLVKTKRFTKSVFDYSKYSTEGIRPNAARSSDVFKNSNVDEGGEGYPQARIPVYKNYFSYEDELGNSDSHKIDVKLNLRKGLLDSSSSYKVIFGELDEPMTITHRAYYKGTYALLEKKEGNKVIPERRFIAIETSFGDSDSFIAYCKLTEQIGLLKAFEQKLEKELLTASEEGLVNIYNKAPSYIINKLSSEIKKRHILELFEIHSSWNFVDGSAGLIKLFKSIVRNQTQSLALYEYLYENPDIVLSIHSDLEGTEAVVVGRALDEDKLEHIPRQTVFSTLMTTLSVINESSKFEESDTVRVPSYRPVFTWDDNRYVDSNVIFSDLNDGKMKLTNYKVQSQQHGIELYRFGESEQNPDEVQHVKLDTHYVNPLDLVIFEVLDGTKAKAQEVVSALVIKELAAAKELGEITSVARIIGDYLIIIVGIILLETGAGGVAAGLAISDITIATADIIIQVSREYWGKEFLRKWDEVYYKFGIATAIIAAPGLIISLLQIILKGLQLATTYAIRIFLRQAFIRLIVDVHLPRLLPEGIKLGYVTVHFGLKSFSSFQSLDQALIKKLQGYGVVFVQVSYKDRFFANMVFYDGKLMAVGSGKSVGTTLGELKVLTKPAEIEELLTRWTDVTLNQSRGALNLLENIVAKAMSKFSNNKMPGAGTVLEQAFKGEQIILETYTMKGLSDTQRNLATHSAVKYWLEKVAPKFLRDRITHGKCAEVRAVSEFLINIESRLGLARNSLTVAQAKQYLKGAKIKTRTVGNDKWSKAFSNAPKAACPSCNPLLNYFEIIEILN